MARKRHPWIRITLTLLFLITSISFLALWRMQNVQVLSIQTNSMAPLLKAGDAVITKHVGLESLAPGTIISYHNPQHPNVTVTHRIVSIDRSTHLIVTRGDNAPMTDPPFDSTLVIGRVSYGLVKLGYALNFLRSPAGLVVGTYLPALGITILELRRLVHSYSQPTYRFVSYIR